MVALAAACPAAGPLTALAELDRELPTIGGKADVTRLAGRHAIKVGMDAVRLRPEEELSYNYNGFRALTHLSRCRISTSPDDVIDFSGRESGGQVSAYVQDASSLAIA